MINKNEYFDLHLKNKDLKEMLAFLANKDIRLKFTDEEIGEFKTMWNKTCGVVDTPVVTPAPAPTSSTFGFQKKKK